MSNRRKKCREKLYGRRRAQLLEKRTNRFFDFSKQAARARPDEHSRDQVRGLSDGERGLGEVAEGEEGEDRRVERDCEEEGQEHLQMRGGGERSG